MKPLDRRLQAWRIARAAKHLPDGARVLDVGCADGALFRRVGHRIAPSVGIDSGDDAFTAPLPHRFVRGRFPDDLPPLEPFDALTMLAVLEHVPPERKPGLVRACADRVKPGGVLVLTVPSPLVDGILAVLVFLRLVDGIRIEQHHGFRVREVVPLLEGEFFSLEVHQRFQLGLNNLFVFRRKSPTSTS